MPSNEMSAALFAIAWMAALIGWVLAAWSSWRWSRIAHDAIRVAEEQQKALRTFGSALEQIAAILAGGPPEASK